MTNSNTLPAVAVLKDQAKRLRAGLSDAGTEIGHGRALELVARQHGYRDWNTLHAAADAPSTPGLSVGQRVRGRYLGKPFAAEIRGLQRLSKAGWHKVSLQFDAPVDVADIAAMPVLRRRVVATVGPHGRTVEKTSDGQPHLVLRTAD